MYKGSRAKVAIMALLGVGLTSTAYAVSISGDGAAEIVTPITAEFFQDLSFGTIAPSTTVDDTVKVNRGNNNSSVCGSNLTCFEPGNRARIRIYGYAGAQFTISNPGSTTLTSGGGDTMLVNGFVGGGSGNDNAWGGFGTIGNSGVRTFNIGAVLNVGAAQPLGTYAGTFTVNVEYQ